MYSRDYYAPDSWYEPDDYYPERECNGCDEKDKIIEQAGEYLVAIVKALYSKENLDAGRLESDLDELCHLLDVKINEGELQIQRKNSLPTFLNDWIKFNNKHLEQLTQG